MSEDKLVVAKAEKAKKAAIFCRTIAGGAAECDSVGYGFYPKPEFIILQAESNRSTPLLRYSFRLVMVVGIWLEALLQVILHLL